jgi:hypothetical protein
MMKQDGEGLFRQTFSLDNGTGWLPKDELERVPLFGAPRRFSCIFLSTSAKDAVRLNHYLSAAGIRAYHACDIREAEILLSITRAKVLLIDIDRTYEPWREILRKLDESRPNLPKVVLTARDHNIWPLLFFQFALDVVPKPAQLGDLLGALECAHQLDQELSDPARARERERRVLAAIRSTAPCGSASVPCSAFHSLQAHWSALMDRVPHFWLKFGCYLTRKQHFHA